jgi:hypothetical protein
MMLRKQHDKGRTLTPEEISAIPNPVLDAENEAITKAKALEANEGNLETAGRAFGEAILALRKVTKRKDYMVRLERLGISYDKARYWLNVVEGKSNDRHRRYFEEPVGVTPNRRKSRGSSAPKPADWPDLSLKLDRLVETIASLHSQNPASDETLLKPVERLAALLGYTLVPVGVSGNQSRVEEELSVN